MENLDTIDPQTLIDLAESQGKHFADKRIRMNQLRNFFDLVDQIRQYQERLRVMDDSGKDRRIFENMIRRDLVLLKPKLAFAAGRRGEMKHFKDFVDEAIDATTQAKADSFVVAVENFITLMESLIAYHKFHSNN